jgi:hypothetical protein
MPLEALNQLLFCHQNINPDDLISALNPDHVSEHESDYVALITVQRSVLRDGNGSNDHTSKEGVLVDLLKNSSDEFLKDFLWFSTASLYMPSLNFKITVEFNHVEMQFDSLPVAHTCNNLIKFPGEAYFGDYDLLKQKLQMSFDHAKACKFDMN